MPTATSLKQFLSAPNNFTELNLSGLSIDDNMCIELAQVLKVNTTISYINLYNNQIGDNGIVAWELKYFVELCC